MFGKSSQQIVRKIKAIEVDYLKIFKKKCLELSHMNKLEVMFIFFLANIKY